ncbi:MAG: FlgD immunoglobulin-like domain containing protein [candidate division WOR-3 bacterium]
MKKTVVAVALALLWAAALGQMDITGVLEAGPEPLQIDSVFMRWSSGSQVFPTPDWSAEPMMQDSFNFTFVPGWPGLIRLWGQATGRPLELSIMLPVQDSWYPFPPPDDQAKVLFHPVVGIQEQRSENQPVLSVVPSLIAGSARFLVSTAGEIVIVDAAGNPVRQLSLQAGVPLVWDGTDDFGRPLPEGVYFCRVQGTDKGVEKLVLVR